MSRSAAEPTEKANSRPSARDRILAAAVRRIASEGIDDVRIARIAMDAGVSSSLVHYHFETREALLAEALEYSYMRAGDVRISNGELPTASHAQRLESMIDQCLPTTASLQDDWVLWVELWLRAVRHPACVRWPSGCTGSFTNGSPTRSRPACTAGEFGPCDADAVADRTLALIDGFGVRTLIGDRRIPLDLARRAVKAALSHELGLGDQLR